MSSTATKSSSNKTSSSSKVVSLPSMTHSLAHLPTMPTVDPRTLHYGGLGASKEASQAKLQQTLQRRDTTSTYGGSSSYSLHAPPAPLYSAPPHKGGSSNDSDYLMMKGRKKPT